MSKNYTWNHLNPYEWMDRVNKHDPLIITVAVNGGIQGREAHPELPETPDQIAQSAHEAYNAGASAVHIHGRDPNCLYNCTGDVDVYREINYKVRSKCADIIINNTTGGGPTTTMEERYKCLDALPELASLNMGPGMDKFKIGARKAPLPHPHDGFIVDDCASYTYGQVEKLAAIMQEKNVKPEMEVYQPGHYWVSRDLIELGLIKPPYYFQFIMGAQTSIFPTPENILTMIREMPKDSMFSVVGIGKFQWQMAAMSIMMGGHVRIGLEDNLYLKRGEKLKNNAAAVEKVVRLARELGREIATPEQAREMLNISKTPRQYEEVK